MAVRERDPNQGKMKEGAEKQEQEYPGSEKEMRPAADHGEKSYKGSGKLKDLRALITGGDSGIGRAVSIAFAREGADVAISYLNEHDDARETIKHVEAAGRRGFSIAGDLSDRDHCQEVVRRSVKEFGGIDILVNNAAFQWEQKDFEKISPEQLEHTFRTNFFAYFWMAQLAVPHMKEGSVIINTGSVTAFDGHEMLLDYSATKGAIHTFTKSLAHSLSKRGIRVNCVAPGPVWTPLIPATFSGEHVEGFGGDTVWGRPAQPAEIAPTYVFLASTDSRFYTGDIFAPTGRVSSR